MISRNGGQFVASPWACVTAAQETVFLPRAGNLLARRGTQSPFQFFFLSLKTRTKVLLLNSSPGVLHLAAQGSSCQAPFPFFLKKKKKSQCSSVVPSLAGLTAAQEVSCHQRPVASLRSIFFSFFKKNKNKKRENSFLVVPSWAWH